MRPGDHQHWRTFLANQLHGIWAAELFVVQTVSFRILYVFFLIRHKRRELVHFKVTANQAAAWIWQQLLEATPWGRRPRFLIHDRDTVYGGDFVRKLASLDIAGVCTPPRGPTANEVLNRHEFTVHGPNQFYTVGAAPSLDEETIKEMVAPSIRSLQPSSEFTIQIRPAVE